MAETTQSKPASKRRTGTRQKLIDSGLKRFYSEGFRNAGLDPILAEVGITKTAFYKHFSCKEELMIEVLQQRAEQMKVQLLELLRELGGNSAAGQLHALIDAIQKVIEGGTQEFRGCIFINASMEFPLLHEPAHQAAARNQAALTHLLHDLGERAGAKSPHALAEELVLIVDGTYVARQVTGAAETFDTARRLLRMALAGHGIKIGKKLAAR